MRDYGLASSASDEGERRALLERAWAEDGVYSDPLARIQGRGARSRHIGTFGEQ